ncbi:MAG: siroheme synthase [Alphaproteobacteria bacterium]|nr:siroheme synthase [Alphaproteobacteria bacterium]
MKVIPIFLKVDQQPVLVIGNGQMAEAKVNLLSSLQAKVKWLTLGEKITAPYGDDVEIIEQKYAKKYLNNITCMFIATHDTKLIEKILAAAQAKNIIYNFVDMPEISQFITPAVVKRDDIMIAISTAGKAPVLARNIRFKINQMLPQNIGKLAEFTYNFRPVAQKMMFESKKLFRFWNDVFSDKNLNLLLSKNDEEKHQHLIDMIKQQHANKGQIVEINLTSRLADDLTLKAHRHINIADVIIYGDDMQEIMGFARRDAKRIHLTNELNVEKLVAAHLASGDLVVYLKPIQSSTPTLHEKKDQHSRAGL